MAWNSCTGNSVKSSSKKLMICQAQNSNIHIYMHIYTTASRRLWKEAECFSNSLLLIAEVCSEICLSLFHWDINEHKDEAKTDKTRKGDVCCACEKLRENGRIPCSLFKGTQAFTSGYRDACRYLDTSYMLPDQDLSSAEHPVEAVVLLNEWGMCHDYKVRWNTGGVMW